VVFPAIFGGVVCRKVNQQRVTETLEGKAALGARSQPALVGCGPRGRGKLPFGVALGLLSRRSEANQLNVLPLFVGGHPIAQWVPRGKVVLCLFLAGAGGHVG